MRRITTDTADNMAIDGVVPGFTDGDAGTFVPPTRLNADAFNNYQEEIARSVEGAGLEVRTDGQLPYYSQLDDAIQQLMEAFVPPDSSEASYVLHGLRFTTSPANTVAVLGPGQMVHEGRRYVITNAKIVNTLQDGWNLTTSSDNYFFIAPTDPTIQVFVPNRTTVFVRHLVVAVGAAAPSTPAGMFRFARITTDATGTTAVQYYGHGPRLANNRDAGIRLRNVDGATTECEIVPLSTTENVDLGILNDPEANTPAMGRLFRSVAAKNHYRRSAYSSLAPQALVQEFTRHVTTIGGSSGANTLINSNDYPEGTVVTASIDGSAFDAVDPTDGVGFRGWCMVVKDGGVWNLVGVPDVETRSLVANGALFQLQLDVGTAMQLQMAFTGHNTDLLRWFADVKLVITGPA